jgi:hypothetical protein
MLSRYIPTPKHSPNLTIELLRIPSNRDIIQLIEDPIITITFVSDGRCTQSKGSFVWVAANAQLELIECKTIARGIPMTSYRAEAYGKLSWILFLKHFKQYFNISPQCQINSFLDNKEIVRSTSLHQDHLYASQALCPDFDLLIAIQQEQK